MKNSAIFRFAIVLGLGSAGLPAHAFMLTRISADHKDGTSSLFRCQLSDYELRKQNQVDGANVVSVTPVTTDAAKIVGLIQDADSLTRPADEPNATELTEWWAKLEEGGPQKLLRVNYVDAYGDRKILVDRTRAAAKLAALLGNVCGFGVH